MSLHHPASGQVTSISSVSVAATFAENLSRSASCLSSILNGDQNASHAMNMDAVYLEPVETETYCHQYGTEFDTSRVLERLQDLVVTKKPTEQPANSSSQVLASQMPCWH
jgi:hypothetical protein